MIDLFGLIFETHVVVLYIWTTKIQMTKMSLESLLPDIFNAVASGRQIFSFVDLEIFYN